MQVLTDRGLPRVEREKPAPTPSVGLPHQAGLDGLRGAAVIGVLAYHLGWLPGGFLGVSLFFTLSGFLITNLLLREREVAGRVRLGRFWAKRARRLLPAALAGIGLAIVATAAVGTADQLRALPGDVIGTAGYAANWRFVLAHDGYRAGFAAPSPLLHYWSLAIEEQLYIVLPLLVVLVAGHQWVGRPRVTRPAGTGRLFVTRPAGTGRLFVARSAWTGRRALGWTLAGLMGVSAAATLLVGSRASDRVYFGTDTRMVELLAGALLASALGFPGTRAGHARRRWADRAGTGAALATAALWVTTQQSDGWLYRGGLWLVAVVSCGLIVGVCWGRLGALARTPVLTGAGRVSYGLYVYHWPVFVALDRSHTGLHGVALAFLRIGTTVALAVASYHWLELPIRQGRGPSAARLGAALPVVLTGLIVSAVLVSGLASARAIAPRSSHPLVLAPPAGGVAPVAAASPRPSLSRVLFMGDSLIQQAYPTFADRLGREGVDSRVVGGNGQSLMTHGGAWLTELQTAVSSFDPDVVVLESCCGQFRFDPPMTGADGHPLAPSSPEFLQAWSDLASHASRIAASRGALVVWILGPPTRTNGWYGPIDGQVADINGVYRAVAACGPRAATIDWGQVGGPGGTYADILPDATGQPVQVRQSDGFHFTPAGIDALASVTLPSIASAWVGGGRAGPWPPTCP